MMRQEARRVPTTFCGQLPANSANSWESQPGPGLRGVLLARPLAQQQRSVSDRLSDAIANFVGSIPFVVLHLCWFGIWVLLNTTKLFSAFRFDPYPFALLCMLVSLEGVLLSTFVLIKQNRMSMRADERSHLDLQINLLSEKELTKILQLQKLICSKLDIKEAELDFEVKELSNVTAVDNIAHELNRRLPRST